MQVAEQGGNAPVISNRANKVYYLPAGCPGYGKVAKKSHVSFDSAVAAKAAGWDLSTGL
ncbi:hypothetical protein [Azotobacter salinestris]|uniref:hypothetical protein n=1 Tax=Azotobacter salinestris TaxID=69964 RepID=UPI0032DF8D8C